MLAGLAVALWPRAPRPEPAAPQQASAPPQAAAPEPAPPTATPAPAPAPRTAAELYRDARAAEAQGEAAKARRDYLALAEQGTETIDPLLRLAALIRAQDGRADARELFARLARAPGGPAYELVHAQQFEGEDRRRRVAEVAAARPDYAPAHYLSAAESSADRMALQTIFDKRAEAAALDAYLAADADGRASRFFLDASVGADWLDKARARRAQLSRELEPAATTPRVTFMQSSAGWTMTITAPEAALALGWKLPGQDGFAMTGASAALDPRTGRPAANPLVQLPPGASGPVEIVYDDAGGRRAGPFPVPFEPMKEMAAGQRQILDQFWTSWIAFGEAGAADLVYYTQLVSYRCGIARAEIGVDDGPMKALALPPCDPARPAAIPNDVTPYFRAPRGARAIVVRLTYADGGQSPERRFERAKP
ncbi:MAG: hypothetical protein IPL88_01630 [Rhizobiales bacterium]|nr:hypothetical protein [Hyphomicrobiales bacterium]